MIHAAGIILVRKDEAVLMQRRADSPDIFWPDHWAYPAGLVDEDEDFEVAARRELKEETGYEASDLALLIEEDVERADGKVVTRHVFWGMYDGKQEIQCNEGAEMKFLKLEELEEKKLLPGNDRLCRLAVEQARSRGLVE